MPGWDFNYGLSVIAGDGDPVQVFRELASMRGDQSIVREIEKRVGLNVGGGSGYSQRPDAALDGAIKMVRLCAGAVAALHALTPLWRRYTQTAVDGLASGDPKVAKDLDAIAWKLMPQFAAVTRSAQTLVGNESTVPLVTLGLVLGVLEATGREAQLIPIHIGYEENGPHEFIVV